MSIRYAYTLAVMGRPLYRGRELKYQLYPPLTIASSRPLYRGRELKSLTESCRMDKVCRPLYRGRELKCQIMVRVMLRCLVALCIGGVS